MVYNIVRYFIVRSGLKYAILYQLDSFIYIDFSESRQFCQGPVIFWILVIKEQPDGGRI